MVIIKLNNRNMKKAIISLLLVTGIIFGYNAHAQTPSDGNGGAKISEDALISIQVQEIMTVNQAEFIVHAGSDKCKSLIEKTAMESDGVKSATYDLMTQTLRIDFNENANLKKVRKSLAKAGFDSGKYTAGNKSYKELPACCKYR